MAVVKCFALVFAALAIAQAVPRSLVSPQANSDQITNLPGLDGGKASFNQYAGYFDLPNTSKHMFYWFVEASGPSDENTPVVLWTNGGPGCSGIIGFLVEHGPFRPTANLTLDINEYAWNSKVHMLYIESPAGVGFSYSDNPSDYTTGDAQTAEDNYNLILQFLARYPQHASRPFFLTSESYGGHYIPTLSKYILDHNTDGAINFKGFAVGNPLTNMIENGIGMYDTFYGHSLVSKPVHDSWSKQCSHGESTLACQKLDAQMQAELGTHIDPYGLDFPVCDDDVAAPGRMERAWLAHRLHRRSSAFKRSALGVVDPFYYQPCETDFAAKYLNQPAVKAAIHANPDITWAMCSDKVNYSQDDVAADMVPIYTDLLSRNAIRMLVYSGDDDSVCGSLGTQSWLWGVDSVKQAWAPWMYNNTRYGVQTGGFLTKFNNMSFATVHGSGHQVPMYRPEAALTLFSRFLDGSLF